MVKKNLPRNVGKCEDREVRSGPKELPLVNTMDVGEKSRSRPFCVGPKSRTMSSAELRWLCEELGRGFEEDLEEDSGSPSSSRLSVLSSLSICSSMDSSSDSSPAESRLPRCMLTSRLRRSILVMKVRVRYVSIHARLVNSQWWNSSSTHLYFLEIEKYLLVVVLVGLTYLGLRPGAKRARHARAVSRGTGTTRTALYVTRRWRDAK